MKRVRDVGNMTCGGEVIVFAPGHRTASTVRSGAGEVSEVTLYGVRSHPPVVAP